MNAPILSPINPPKIPPTIGAKGPRTGVRSAVVATVPIVAPIPPPAATFILSPAASRDPNESAPANIPPPTPDRIKRPIPVIPLNDPLPAILPANLFLAALPPNLLAYLCLANLDVLPERTPLGSLLPLKKRSLSIFTCCCLTLLFLLPLNSLDSFPISPANFQGIKILLATLSAAIPPITFSTLIMGPSLPSGSNNPSYIRLNPNDAVFHTSPNHLLIQVNALVIISLFSFFDRKSSAKNVPIVAANLSNGSSSGVRKPNSPLPNLPMPLFLPSLSISSDVFFSIFASLALSCARDFLPCTANAASNLA